MIDLIGYLAFWAAPNYFVNIGLIGIPMNQWLATSVIGFIMTVILAPSFGKWMGLFRRIFGVE